MQKKDIFDVLKVALILFVVTAISAGILATINTLTKPIITANAEKKLNDAMSKVISGADSFKKIEYNSNSSVTQVFIAEDKGYVVLCEPNGYADTISLVVGIDTEGVVTGIDITSQSETAGLGSNCTNEDFKNQYLGKTGEISVVKQGAVGNQIDAISSATVTSKAVTKGVNDALSAVNEITGKGGVSN